MKNLLLSRRTLLSVAGVLAEGPIVCSEVVAQPSATDAASFIGAFDDAWARHDAHALAALHSENVVVVNRYGSLLEGREELEKALQFLHGPGGPFHTITFPRQKILISRRLNNDLVTLHTKWKNPTMGPGDQLANHGQTSWIDMIATYLLSCNGRKWELLQHDLHNVDPIQFPFATKWNS